MGGDLLAKDLCQVFAKILKGDTEQKNNVCMITREGSDLKPVLSSAEQTVDNIEQLKQELLQFLDFDKLTPEILHRMVKRIEVKSDGIPVIHYAFSAPKNWIKAAGIPYLGPAASFKTICETHSTCVELIVHTEID